MQIPSDVRIAQAKARHFTGDFGPWLEHLVQDERMDLGQARMLMERYEAIPFVDPKHGHMATLIKHNNEVHFAIYRKFRGRNHIRSSRIKSFLQPILDAEHFLVTKLGAKDDERFILHLGFQQLGSTIDGIKTYILTEIKYPRCKNGSNKIQND